VEFRELRMEMEMEMEMRATPTSIQDGKPDEVFFRPKYFVEFIRRHAEEIGDFAGAAIAEFFLEAHGAVVSRVIRVQFWRRSSACQAIKHGEGHLRGVAVVRDCQAKCGRRALQSHRRSPPALGAMVSSLPPQHTLHSKSN